ncbi:MAG TPA: DegV family protein [Anaerolineaceae bacterium]|jgi:DegV family protein with EDD domain
MIRIIADTTAGLPPEYTRAHNIPVLPQIVTFGDQSYRDDTELDMPAFLQKLCTSTQMPKTAAPPPSLYTPIYEEILAAGDTVLVIAPTSLASGTMRSALTAAQDFPCAGIHVLDTRSVAGPLGVMVRLAADWAEAGETLETILERLQGLMVRQRFYLLVDTLEFLHRGGRIGGAAHLFGSLLQVKPLLALRDGRVEAHSQQRTKRRAVECLQQIVLAECAPGKEGHLCVMHTGVEAEAHALAEYFCASLDLPAVPIYGVPASAAVHAGPGALAAGFFTREG